MDNKQPYTYKISQSTTWINEIPWQPSNTPFMDFRFWQALRDTKALGEESGWIENYVLIYSTSSSSLTKIEHFKTKQPIAVLPAFIKYHHRGEFVFDHAWAEAFHRYGFDYYPRLVTSAPYSPITGERFWLAEGIELNTKIIQTALQGVYELANTVNASSWHGLYFEKKAVTLAHQLDLQNKLLERQGCQFQWFNQHINENNRKFINFDDFLSTFTAKKRKNIRQERKKIAKQNLTTRRLVDGQITIEDWEVFYQCYAMTYLVRGQRPYLQLEFFLQLGETMPEHLMLIQGLNKDNEVVASALFLYDRPTAETPMLYGRYWGSLDEFDSLHFELCYYQGIEFAIEKGLETFDPGTQGEHKLLRGFIPTITHSIHQVYNEPFVEPIDEFCQEEQRYMAEYRKQAFESLPFNVDNMPENEHSRH